ncbi:endonuclease/exonuclease/phosphatase family protein [Leptotrichia sp. HSP-334]|uniref:Endonuclease/exonuclease/phosphatase family protein n=1 Tax=Leptotrichia rugosa TaxID=3239302 RepID=A0AB39VHF3_9FUSO
MILIKEKLIFYTDKIKMEFRIITYNIFGERLTNGRELARSLKKYNPDFIGLQEVDRNTKRSKFRDVVQDSGYSLWEKYFLFLTIFLTILLFRLHIFSNWNFLFRFL